MHILCEYTLIFQFQQQRGNYINHLHLPVEALCAVDLAVLKDVATLPDPPLWGRHSYLDGDWLEQPGETIYHKIITINPQEQYMLSSNDHSLSTWGFHNLCAVYMFTHLQASPV